MRNTERRIDTSPERIEEYLGSLAQQRDPVLIAMEKDATRRSLSTIGPLVGRILSIILKSAKRERALEIGTGTGYSGIWIVRSLQGDNKKLTTIELDPGRCKDAQANFMKAGVDNYVELMVGDARSIVPELAVKGLGLFDFVFLDVGDKALYVDLLDLCVSLLRVGGFLVADNTLWAVAVPKDKSPNATAIRKFNKLVFSNKRLDAAIIPFPDSTYKYPYGFTVALKKMD